MKKIAIAIGTALCISLIGGFVSSYATLQVLGSKVQIIQAQINTNQNNQMIEFEYLNKRIDSIADKNGH